MPSTCIFTFDRQNPIYFNGETIEACVTLTTTSEKPCREVYIEFKGEANVRWVESRNKSSTTYRGKEVYVSTRKNVHPEGQLPPGTYNYTLAIPLPMEVPSSCVAEYGDVKYEISLTINRPYHFDNVFRMPITVIKNLDLNFIPELLIPLQEEDVKYLCYWPCKSGPIISTLEIPFGGYVSGQNIPYTVNIDNRSHYDLTGICLRLLQTCTCAATEPHLKIQQKTAQMVEVKQDETVLRLSKRVLEGNLCIPPSPPSSIKQHIITIDYDIELTIKTGRFHKDSKLEVPIKIGTIPLHQTVANADIQPTAPPTSQTLSDASGPSPPIYTESTALKSST